jgi:hypothetical protein
LLLLLVFTVLYYSVFSLSHALNDFSCALSELTPSQTDLAAAVADLTQRWDVLCHKFAFLQSERETEAVRELLLRLFWHADTKNTDAFCQTQAVLLCRLERLYQNERFAWGNLL